VLEPADVVEQVRRGATHVLALEQSILGVVFVEPVTTEMMSVLARWGLDEEAHLWFLRSLVVEPDLQGQGLGLRLLDGVEEYVASRSPGTIVLDCWAGNERLRTFYIRAGYDLQGEFPNSTGEYSVAVFIRRVRGTGEQSK
jgi:GNAT superfamily N-acetyltransferase